MQGSRPLVARVPSNTIGPRSQGEGAPIAPDKSFCDSLNQEEVRDAIGECIN
jgi:hypothetical protein